MYKPILEDIQTTEWKMPIAEDPTKQVAQVILYLNGGAKDAFTEDGKKYHFGYFLPVEVGIEATDEEKETTLKSAALQLLKDFDVAKIAREEKYEGDLEYLRPLRLSGTQYPWRAKK